MLRLLHTGDWHIGQVLRGHARDGEHRAVLARVVRIAAEREVDVTIVRLTNESLQPSRSVTSHAGSLAVIRR